MKRTAIKRKRGKPRRNDGRVKHDRIKPKATGTTSEEADYLKFIVELGCLVCGGHANKHHVMSAPGKVKRRDHRFVAPLCYTHHQGCRKDGSVHGLGSEAAFYEFWGFDLVGWCISAWEYRDDRQNDFWVDSVTDCRNLAYPILKDIEIGRGAIRTNKQLNPASNQR